jgi:hypothetical protein
MRFTNERGNVISITAIEKDIEGHPGVFITIEGPDSTATLHITQQEAEVLLRELMHVTDRSSE